MYALFALIVLSLIVTIHELGHFFVARLCGVGVIEFSIGMGPVILHKRIKDTVYSIRALPVGGYCAMYGENAPETADKGSNERKKKKREPNFKTDWNKNQSFKSKSKFQQLLILLAGPASNILTGIVISFLSVLIFGARCEPKIESIMSVDCPAAEAGFEANDIIVGINDREILTFMDYNLYKTCNPNKIQNGYTITVKKPNGEYHSAFVTPDENTGLIGIVVETYLEPKHGTDLIKYTYNYVQYWFRLSIDSVKMVCTGQAQFKDMTGFIGTTAVMGDTIENASTSEDGNVLFTLFTLVNFISINLGLMNLLPIPALDGGRAIITYIEGALNKEMPLKLEAAINAVGFCMVILLMIATTLNDISRLIMQ